MADASPPYWSMVTISRVLNFRCVINSLFFYFAISQIFYLHAKGKVYHIVVLIQIQRRIESLYHFRLIVFIIGIWHNKNQ